MTFKKYSEQTMPALTEKEQLIMEEVKKINVFEEVGSIAELGNIQYLIANLEQTINNWQGLSEEEMVLFDGLRAFGIKSSHGEFELSQAFINSENEDDYKELEPEIYFFCGKVVDPRGERGFLSEHDVELFLKLEAKSPEVLADKERFLKELKEGVYNF